MSAALKKPAAPVLKQRNGAMIGTRTSAHARRSFFASSCRPPPRHSVLKAAWYVHIKDGSEQTIVTWLKSMGWTVEVNDMRDDEADEEEE